MKTTEISFFRPKFVLYAFRRQPVAAMLKSKGNINKNIQLVINNWRHCAHLNHCFLHSRTESHTQTHTDMNGILRNGHNSTRYFFKNIFNCNFFSFQIEAKQFVCVVKARVREMKRLFCTHLNSC